MVEDLPIVKGIRMVRKCDIVEWLRSHEDNDLVDMDGMNEAANEIVRLREVMEKVSDALYDKGNYECWAALRNALWQEGDHGQTT